MTVKFRQCRKFLYRKQLWVVLVILVSVFLVYSAINPCMYNTLYNVALSINDECNTTLLEDYHRSKVRSQHLKIIYGATPIYGRWSHMFNFTGCKFSNCVVQWCPRLRNVEHADVVIYLAERMHYFPRLSVDTRSHQKWLLMTRESPARWWFRWKPWVNGQFNGTMTYRHDSEVVAPYGTYYKHETHQQSKDYTVNKTRGAFAYVSNCESDNYNRLDLMKRLKDYIDVDVFGSCAGLQSPCQRGDWDCEEKLHGSYRFFLSFENSLCEDYITEKFFQRLKSTSYLLPIAMGGSDLIQYTSIAPPDSFLHVYNFTSIASLGDYLRKLTNDNQMYNKYHTWREKYYIVPTDAHMESKDCRLCELANSKASMPVNHNLQSWWNDGVCKDFTVK